MIISSFYIGNGGQYIGFMNSVQDLEGSENWEQSFTRNSKVIYDGILKVTNEVVCAALKEEITLTIVDKLEGKYSESEIRSLTLKRHAGIKIGID